MLPAWATVTVAAISALAALFGGWFQGWRDDKRQLAEERRRTRELGSRALASAMAAIADASPDGLSINTRPEMFAYLEGVRDEWRTTIRPALLEFAVRTDSAEAGRFAKELAVEIPKGINQSIFLVEGILKREQTPHDSVSDYWKSAKAKNESLEALAAELERALSAP